MKLLWPFHLGLLIGAVLAAPAAAQTIASTGTLVNTYCVTCHNQRLRTADLVLEGVDADRPEAQAELWEKVVRKLRSGTMPPRGLPRPDDVALTNAVASLEARLDAVAAKAPNPGRPVLHRLNRAEYANAIRDLLAFDIDAREMLPADDSGYGFDNIADVLTLSPGLFDRYLSAARRIAREAIGDPSIRPVTHTLSRLPVFRVQTDRMGEGLPFGSRGGAAVRHNFPLDGEYALRINFHRGTMSGVIRGLQDDNEVDVRVDGTRVKLFVLSKSAGRNVGGYTDGTGHEPLQLRLNLKGGVHTIAVSLRKVTTAYEGWGPTRMPVTSNSFATFDRSTSESGEIEVSVEYVEVEGPFNPSAPAATASRNRILSCRPAAPANEEACARRILSTLAYRAYRRPVTPVDRQALLGFYRQGRKERGFEGGIQFALERILIDPSFLFRVERGARTGASSAGVLDDFDLASRLSFFLWSSIPDDELLDLAARGRLRDPQVFERQVRRMIADARSQALVLNFFGQWLMLRNMNSVVPDPTAYPDFDDNLREGLRRETELFLESQLREDRSAFELLDADYTFVNERVARHYGIPHVYGSHFRRLMLTDDRRRGLMGHGSILTVTSYANRTSPVLRGKWLLQNILGTPPPPPPANVPPLENTPVVGTLRQRMEQHRRNPACAACHAQLDPLGFALENFDGIGRWRSTDAQVPIDASGVMPDGTKFDGPASFREALLGHREQFVMTLTEKLMTYALGRGVEYYDMPAVRKIMRDAKPADYRWSSIILGVVRSVPFQMRRPQS